MASNLWSSERLIYRGVDTEDEDFLAELSANADAFLNVAPLLPVPRSKKTTQEFREYLHQPMFLVSAIVCIAPTQPDETKKTEEDKSKSIPIGILTLRGDDARNQHHRRCEIGINLLRAYQGKGYGSEAIRWSLRWGFKRANLHRMEIGAFSWNARAVQLYERLGFVHEGRRRDFFWHDGKYHDSVEMSMLEHEWRELYDGQEVAVR